MYNEDKSLVLVFNGEIYNYRELRKDLLDLGHCFRTESDSECLLHAYEAYGREMVGRLRGMYAFAIWDKMSMAHSLESRVPYLDSGVYQAARGLTEKEKLGFPAPIRVWLKQPEYYEKVRKCFCSPAAERFFVSGELVRLLGEHLEDKKDNSRKIWTVYVFLIWYQVYFQGQ